jgi:hypothetical protein
VDPENRNPQLGGRKLTLESAGLTLLGIILSIGTTVGFGIRAAWWVRVLGGVASAVLLILVVGFLARPGAGPVARLARWLTRT